MSNDAPNEITVASHDNVGTNKLTLSDHRGLVVMHFDKKVNYVAIQPNEARDLGEKLARQSYRAIYGDYPTTQDRSQITEQMRIRARNRVTTMLQNYEPKTKAEIIAKASAIVDEIMKIVL